jgi:hypothetical protein
MLSTLRPPIVDNRPKPQNPFEGYDFMKGFEDSEFYKKANRMQQDVAEFKFDGKDMMMNSSMAGALSQYLDSIGKGDLIQSNLLYRGPLQPGKGPGGVTLRPGAPTQEKFFSEIGQLPNGTGTQMPIGGTPITNTGIGSLTQNPINTTPESNMTGSMTSSPYLNNNQDLDQYLNSYVENLINRRMRDIFGGIMSIFQ